MKEATNPVRSIEKFNSHYSTEINHYVFSRTIPVRNRTSSILKTLLLLSRGLNILHFGITARPFMMPSFELLFFDITVPAAREGYPRGL